MPRRLHFDAAAAAAAAHASSAAATHAGPIGAAAHPNGLCLSKCGSASSLASAPHGSALAGTEGGPSRCSTSGAASLDGLRIDTSDGHAAPHVGSRSLDASLLLLSLEGTVEFGVAQPEAPARPAAEPARASPPRASVAPPPAPPPPVRESCVPLVCDAHVEGGIPLWDGHSLAAGEVEAEARGAPRREVERRPRSAAPLGASNHDLSPSSLLPCGPPAGCIGAAGRDALREALARPLVGLRIDSWP